MLKAILQNTRTTEVRVDLWKPSSTTPHSCRTRSGHKEYTFRSSATPLRESHFKEGSSELRVFVIYFLRMLAAWWWRLNLLIKAGKHWMLPKQSLQQCSKHHPVSDSPWREHLHKSPFSELGCHIGIFSDLSIGRPQPEPGINDFGRLPDITGSLTASQCMASTLPRVVSDPPISKRGHWVTVCHLHSSRSAQNSWLLGPVVSCCHIPVMSLSPLSSCLLWLVRGNEVNTIVMHP